MNDELAALWPDRAAILARMEGTIRYMARKYTFVGQEYEDVLAQARLIVWESLVDVGSTERLYSYLRLRLMKLQDYIKNNQTIAGRWGSEGEPVDVGTLPAAAATLPAATLPADLRALCVSETERVVMQLLLDGHTRSYIRQRLRCRNAELVRIINGLGNRIQSYVDDPS